MNFLLKDSDSKINYRNVAHYSLLICMLLIKNTYSQSYNYLKDLASSGNKHVEFGQSVFRSGYILIGEGYGSMPYIYQGQPSFYFKSESSVKLQVGSLPLNLSYSHTDLNNNTGISNYFKISIDPPTFKKIKEAEIGELKDSIDSKLEQEYKRRQNLLKQKLSTDYELKHSRELFRDSVGSVLSRVKSGKDSTAEININEDSEKKVLDKEKLQFKIDSLKKIKTQLDASIKSVNGEIKKLEKVKARSKQNYSLGNFSTPAQTRLTWSNFLSGFRQFEIGSCSPNYSTFLIANIALHGVSAEWQFNNLYIASTVGKTTNNFFFNRNSIPGKVDELRNTFNFFDFNDYDAGKNIFVVKLGYGKKEDSHIYVGRLWGKGYNNNLLTNISANANEIEKNTVTELDGRLVINKNISLDLIAAKSSLEDDQDNVIVSSASSTTNNSLKNNSAALSKVTYSMAACKLRLTGSLRFIGPFFKSFGLGFLNSDQLRYELRADKNFGKIFQSAVFYRKEQNNISNLISSTTTIQSFGIATTAKIAPQLTLKTDIQKCFIASFNTESDASYNSKNFVGTIGVTYVFRGKKLPATSTLYYSYYNVISGYQLSQNKMISYVLSMNHKSGLNINYLFSFSNQESNDSHSVSRNLTSELSCDYKFNSRVIVASKIKYGSSGSRDDIGAGIKFSYSATTHLDFIVSAEKYLSTEIIYGDVNNYKKFPYNGILQLKYHW